MNGEFMSKGLKYQVLKVLNELHDQMKMKNHYIPLFIDDATCHGKFLGNILANLKSIFLPKNAASTIQPLDADIFCAFSACKTYKVNKKDIRTKINEQR